MILVTGGTGVMGRVLLKKLHGKGEEIRVFTLPGDPDVKYIKKYTSDIRYGTIENRDDVSGICEGIETVYHCAAIILSSDNNKFHPINTLGTKYLVEDATLAGVNHFIYISSASVVYPRPTPYSLSKKNAESIVISSGLKYTIIRPTLVYDNEKGSLEFDLFLDYLRKFTILPFIGSGKYLKRPVYVSDIIDGLVMLNSNKKAINKTYNFSGGESISMIDFTSLCLKLLGTPNKIIISIPVWLCKIIAFVMKLTMKNPILKWQTIAGITQDANLDPKDAINDLDYNPQKISIKLKDCFPRIK